MRPGWMAKVLVHFTELILIAFSCMAVGLFIGFYLGSAGGS